MKILGIETSCDETAAAVVLGGNENALVLSNIVSSQIEIHKKYGGVVPEVAAREHILNILPVIDKALISAGLDRKKPKLDAIAVTVGPGLITSLITGIETAKTLSYAWNIPVIAVNHIEAHIYANFIILNQKSKIENQKLQFPAVILTVSGGHTMLVFMEGHGKLKTIGETRDDAAGEAFDKAAKMLGIGYPGGPAIAACAEKSRIQNPEARIKLPRPMFDSDNFDFSFSGLKTALRYALEADKDWKNNIPAYCAEFQQAVIDVLIHKTIMSAKKYNAKTVMLAGGVSANSELRRQIKESVENNDLKFSLPDLKYTTDNAAMAAAAGYFKALRREFTPWQNLRVDCNLEL